MKRRGTCPDGRIYETRFKRADYEARFGEDFDQVYGRYVKLMGQLGFVKDDGEQVRLTDRGAFWLHALEDVLSINYIGTLWGAAKRDPWPEKVAL
jgi:oxygen-independent coproporphyrinogen-3 oxidase